ncbi:lasso RiPP family leader peptide-containing protein [Streptomyces iconiensis]|uniref:Lasso RiPP family leader peptide-containing protein n=1 Tax=Streptomyces iconiensis TaxID=1384038 RepID=A0ABT7A197_9ACTN|nr:lasso RiPP family leader peptide-containing protein [Streptomyces iconiensis]MDJ1134847.1 lasso RiPP family leader peptide-containing protein [Streptomyces iconiensis]
MEERTEVYETPAVVASGGFEEVTLGPSRGAPADQYTCYRV